MKILLISEYFPTGKELQFSGGVEARNLFLAKYLSRNNDVVVITSKIKGTKNEEKILGFRVLRVGPERKYFAASGAMIRRLQFIKAAIATGSKINCDIVDGSNFVTHFIAKSISKKNKIPAVAWYPDVWLGSWFKNAGILGLFGEILERLNLLRGFDGYIAISKTTAVKLKKRLGKDIKIIYCGVEFSEFQKKISKSKSPKIITVSRLTKYKNIDKLILAFSLITLKRRNINLTIIGSGPEENYLKELASQLKVSKKIDFISNLSRQQLIKSLKSASIFCLPSIVEGFGIATLEAAAAGLPYVVSDIEVFKEVTKNGRGGFLFASGNIKDIALKIERLLIDKNLYNQKSKEAASLAKGYSWQQISENTQKYYKEVISSYHE